MQSLGAVWNHSSDSDEYYDTSSTDKTKNLLSRGNQSCGRGASNSRHAHNPRSSNRGNRGHVLQVGARSRSRHDPRPQFPARQQESCDRLQQYPDRLQQYPDRQQHSRDGVQQFADRHQQFPNRQQQSRDRLQQFPDRQQQSRDGVLQFADRQQQFPNRQQSRDGQQQFLDRQRQFPDRLQQSRDRLQQFPDWQEQFLDRQQHSDRTGKAKTAAFQSTKAYPKTTVEPNYHIVTGHNNIPNASNRPQAPSYYDGRSNREELFNRQNSNSSDIAMTSVNPRSQSQGPRTYQAKFDTVHDVRKLQTQGERKTLMPHHEKSNAPENMEKRRGLGFKKLQELITKDSGEILLTLCQPENRLSQFLEKVEDKRDIIALLLVAVGKACNSNHRSNVSHLIKTVTQSMGFMYCTIPKYLIRFKDSKNESYHLDSIEQLLQFYSCFITSFTASATDALQLVLPHIKEACKKAFAVDEQQLNMLQNKIKDIEEQQESFLKCRTSEEVSKASKVEKAHFQSPPEDYRTIPVLPNMKDILEYVPFLRPNIVASKYQDVEHYLDVQFRLLREDYIRPLREGISTYTRLKKQGKSTMKNKDVRIYENVQVIKQEFLNCTLVHVAKFDVKEFSRVNWEHSKRFMTGCLLCLSHDNFETMSFATIAFRDPEKLKQGLLLLQFEDLSADTLNINPFQKHAMIETTAYFEAYRHNLSALHSMTPDNFPMQNYIVHLQQDIENPQYLHHDTRYDMAPLFANAARKVCEKYVPVLHEKQWPSCNDFGLDQSQYKALQTAITREFSVIQGPPGTGKTYVGLKIVQLLLHNSNIWKGIDTSPILIVCYTNHALDQFLEEIQYFTDKLVRVGGRCTNEAIGMYQLKNLKQSIRLKREVPSHIFSNVRQQQLIFNTLKTNYCKLSKDIGKSQDAILSDELLKFVMTKGHYESLRMNYTFPEIHDTDFLITSWLGIQAQNFEITDPNDAIEIVTAENVTPAMTNLSVTGTSFQPAAPAEQVPVTHFGNVTHPGLLVNENQESDSEEEEGDMDFIEGMRDVDTEDYRSINLTVEDNQPPESDWKVQGGQKKRSQFIEQKLSETVPMLQAEAESVMAVWRLPSEDRWRLYKYWLVKFIQMKQEELFELQAQIKEEFNRLKEMRNEEDLYLMRDADIVGMTTTGAAKYRQLVLSINPKIVIVEEAAEVLEAHIVTSLVKDTKHVILIGDHEQLRPSPTVYELAMKFHLDISLFERMVKNGMPYCQLLNQHRMRPAIAELITHIYPNLKNHESVMDFEDIKGVTKNIFFVTHQQIEGGEIDSKSKVNEHEAKFMIRLCRHLILQGYDQSRITILTTYSGQLFALKRLAQSSGHLLKGVRITVVDNFQGEENDIILISFVRSNEDGVIGFLKVSNRVCVALSRARKGLFCIGNFHLFAEKSEIWRNILNTLEGQKAIGPAMKLQCQNHPEVFTDVATERDFEKAPEGGCTRLCDFRLDCGHTCVKICHSYDREHKKDKCRKPCSKIICEQNHKCQLKCFQPCEPCKVLVKKELPLCKHIISVRCSIPAHKVKCTEPCFKSLRCGHRCMRKCGEICAQYSCIEMVSIMLPCGHEEKVQCHESDVPEDFLDFCSKPCNTELQCGHNCSGTCGKCRQGRLHQLCRNRCTRILICGHECKSLCSNMCPPCKRRCENRCVHSKCEKTCGEPCIPCIEKCNWFCKHHKCEMQCGELCNRQPCEEPCENIIKACGHKCIGLCGEPCPKKCLICNREEVQSIFFGTEEDEDARFVELEDCDHILEVTGLTTWMERESGGEIQMKSCPKCKTVIRRNLRFGNTVKSCLGDIEKVKAVVFGDKKQNEVKKQVLINKAKDFQYKLQMPIVNYLEKKKMISSLDIVKCENTIMLAKEFVSAKSSVEQAFIGDIRSPNLKATDLEKLETMYVSTHDMISEFLRNEYTRASEQQFQDIANELSRFQQVCLLKKFVSERRHSLLETHAPLFTNVVDTMCKLGPFTDVERGNSKRQFDQLKVVCGSAAIGVSMTEKTMILNAMNLSKGHWYQCPNGHVYCIADCGGAVEQSKCNECNAQIGGTQHRLLGNNRVATAMDGARQGAWPETANMQNYGF